LPDATVATPMAGPATVVTVGSGLTEKQAAAMARGVIKQLKAKGYSVSILTVPAEPVAAEPAPDEGPTAAAPAAFAAPAEKAPAALVQEGASTDEAAAASGPQATAPAAVPGPAADATQFAAAPAGTAPTALLAATPPAAGTETPLTPLLPSALDAARAAGSVGLGLLLGGADVEDQSATLMVYHSPSAAGPERPVLFLKLLPAAEQKVRAAKAAAQGLHFMTVTKEVERFGRAPFDTEGQIAETIVAAAKSANAHAGDGTPVPEKHAHALAAARAALLKALMDPGLTPEAMETAEQYLADIEEILGAIQHGQKTPKHYAPRQCRWVQRVEEQVPVPPPPGDAPKLHCAERPGSRPATAQLPDGTPVWDGARRETGGQEWTFDFGDGWTAVYHPSDRALRVPFSQRGILELHLPPDPTAVSQIPAHLARLNIVGSPASVAEAEVVYLERMAWAVGARETAAYQRLSAARAALVAQRAAVLAFAADSERPEDPELQAEREILPRYGVALRRLLEQHLKLPEGSVAAHPRYDPRPVWDHCGAGHGHWRWTRFDVDPDTLNAKAKKLGVHIVHTVTGENAMERLKHILKTGVLAAQERRPQMGVDKHGISPDEDQHSGGAAYIFASVYKSLPSRVCLVWDPGTLLQRSDWFFRRGDYFGAVNPDDHRFTQRVTDPEEVLRSSSKGKNEIVFKDGIGMFGAFAPRQIRVPSGSRDALLQWCHDNGVTEIGDSPVEDVIVGY